MKTLILYKTKHGSTKQYAEWLNEDLQDSVVKNIKDFDIKELADYKQIIIGSCDYMGRVSAKGFLVSHWDKLKEKKVYLFRVGMSPVDSEESKRGFEMIPQNIRDGLVGHTKLPGKIDMDKLGFFMKWIVKKVGDGKSEDKMDRSLLKPILEAMGG